MAVGRSRGSALPGLCQPLVSITQQSHNSRPQTCLQHTHFVQVAAWPTRCRRHQQQRLGLGGWEEGDAKGEPWPRDVGHSKPHLGPGRKGSKEGQDGSM
jgi:hypothetical protein